jgi:hypothetical protein
MANYGYIIELIESPRKPKTIESMAKFGINVINACGLPIPFLRPIAGQIRKGNGESHNLLAHHL